MAVETERKFLVTNTSWSSAPSILFCQGYLNREKHRTIRIRLAGDDAFLTVKGPTVNASRLEFEYSVPVSDAQEMLTLCEKPLIEKRRRLIEHAGMTWEVDEFLGDNAGLVVAEIELESIDQPIEIPSWVGDEVTLDPRYHNSNLVRHPYKDW